MSAGPVGDALTDSRAIHHLQGFRYEFVGHFHSHGDQFAVRRGREAVILGATTQADEQGG
ncbi:hypothetical protein D3C85_1806010 [compost metagenome]